MGHVWGIHWLYLGNVWHMYESYVFHTSAMCGCICKLCMGCTEDRVHTKRPSLIPLECYSEASKNYQIPQPGTSCIREPTPAPPISARVKHVPAASHRHTQYYVNTKRQLQLSLSSVQPRVTEKPQPVTNRFVTETPQPVTNSCPCKWLQRSV